MRSVVQAIHRARLGLEVQLITVGETTNTIVQWPNYQLKLEPDGVYHRHGTIVDRTACGEPIQRDVGVLRSHVLDDQLCPACFSLYELQLGLEFARKRDA